MYVRVSFTKTDRTKMHYILTMARGRDKGEMHQFQTSKIDVLAQHKFQKAKVSGLSGLHHQSFPRPNHTVFCSYLNGCS